MSHSRYHYIRGPPEDKDTTTTKWWDVDSKLTQLWCLLILDVIAQFLVYLLAPPTVLTRSTNYKASPRKCNSPKLHIMRFGKDVTENPLGFSSLVLLYPCHCKWPSWAVRLWPWTTEGSRELIFDLLLNHSYVWDPQHVSWDGKMICSTKLFRIPGQEFIYPALWTEGRFLVLLQIYKRHSLHKIKMCAFALCCVPRQQEWSKQSFNNLEWRCILVLKNTCGLHLSYEMY